ETTWQGGKIAATHGEPSMRAAFESAPEMPDALLLATVRAALHAIARRGSPYLSPAGLLAEQTIASLPPSPTRCASPGRAGGACRAPVWVNYRQGRGDAGT